MSDKDEKNKSPPGEAPADDLDLWAQAVCDVKPLPGRNKTLPRKEQQKPLPMRVSYGDRERTYSKKVSGKVPGPGIDKRTDERLRRGEMEIEARIDLHGLNQDEARDELADFIVSAQAAGKRCVLVITGTGKRSGQDKDEEEWFMPQKGVLKQKVPEWLTSEKLRPLIVQTHPAQRRHGGEGALYVLLRRNRD